MTTNHLDQWLADEKAVFERIEKGPGPGVARMDQIAGMTGLELMQAILNGTLPYAAIAKTLDFVLIDVSKGHATFQGTPGPQLFNPMGTVHGGWFATLLDTAMGCAVYSTLPAGKAYTTLQLKLNLVRALTDAVPLVRAEGRLVHGGRQVATAEGRLVGPDGKLYAHASTTCLVFDLKG